MCLTTNDPTKKIADRDIQVYKSLNYAKQNWFARIFKPLPPHSVSYHAHEYRRGITQPRVIMSDGTQQEVYGSGVEYYFNPGYHSDASPNFGANSIFIIPKGTTYVEGWFNDDKQRVNYISETIVYKGRLPKKRK